MSEEKLFFNGVVYTVDPDNPWVEAVWIKDGIIQYAGSESEARRQASDQVEEIDMQGGFMMPGIHDVHVHPLEAATESFQFILDDSIDDPEDYKEPIADANRRFPGNDWLLGWGHWIDTPLEATRPPKEIIDAVVSDRPIAILEQTSHSVWCNSKALELLNISNATPDPPGGVIMREENGEASGILVDNAGNLMLDVALAPNPSRSENDYLGLLEFSLPELRKYGITSICDARTYWKRAHHMTWRKINEENKLTVRVVLGLWAYPNEDDLEQINSLKSLYSNDANSLLRMCQIKLYIDGIVHNTTSAMHDDFRIDYFERPVNNGLNYFTQERIEHYISILESTGFDFHIHAIGNRGVHEALNAIKLGSTGIGRHRLTHVEYIDRRDISRFAELNVTADAQVAGDFTQPENWHHNDYLLDPSLNENVIPLKSLQESGARITLSSDWDVSTLNPFEGLQNAITRTPQELTLEEAIKAYTIHGAYTMRQEHIVGSIEAGKEADVILLDRNLFEIPVDQISQTVVLKTFIRGQKVYEKL